MPKGPQGQKRPADVIGCAVDVAQIATGEKKDTSYAPQNRHKSGVAGAKARMKKLTANERSEIATKAALKRWKNGEKEMTQNCSTSLHNLLSGDGRELQNIKFLAGSNPTENGMAAEATKVIRSAMDRGMPHNPPITGVEKSKI